MGIARLYANGTLDTTWMETAYNQFAGLHKGRVNDPANHVRDIGVQADDGVLIGGSFARVGGGFTRDDLSNQSNITRLVGGSTEGPGNIQLVQDEYTVDENTVICLSCLIESMVNWVLPWQMSPFLKPSRVLVWPMRVVITIRFLRQSFGLRFTGKIVPTASM